MHAGVWLYGLAHSDHVTNRRYRVRVETATDGCQDRISQGRRFVNIGHIEGQIHDVGSNLIPKTALSWATVQSQTVQRDTRLLSNLYV